MTLATALRAGNLTKVNIILDQKKSYSVLERELEQLTKRYEQLEQKYINEKKTQAIHAAMKGRKYNSREQVVKLSWDDLVYDPATETLSALGYDTPKDYFRVRAEKIPYELVGGNGNSTLRRRSEMDWKERADFIDKNSPEDYLALPD